MYPLKKVLFTTDASYVMEREGCDLDEAQYLIEDEWGGLKDFPIIATLGKLKRWDGIHDLEDIKSKSISNYIAHLISCKADDVYIGEDDEGVLLATWTHHDGWGMAILIHDVTGEVVTSEELWAY